MTAPVKYASFPSRPSSDFLLDNGYASECGMKPAYDCGDCAKAGRGRACDTHRHPGIGVSFMPSAQEVAYVETTGARPPAPFADGSPGAAQFNYPAGAGKTRAEQKATATALAAA